MMRGWPLLAKCSRAPTVMLPIGCRMANGKTKPWVNAQRLMGGEPRFEPVADQPQRVSVRFPMMMPIEFRMANGKTKPWVNAQRLMGG